MTTQETFNLASRMKEGLDALASAQGSKFRYTPAVKGGRFTAETNVPLRDGTATPTLGITVDENESLVLVRTNPDATDDKLETSVAYSGPDAARYALETVRAYAERKRLIPKL